MTYLCCGGRASRIVSCDSYYRIADVMRPRFHDGLDVIRQMHMIEFSLASKRRPEIVLHCITILSNNNKKDNFEFNLKLIA